MIILADIIGISITLLTIFIFIVSLLLILIVVAQRPKQEGLGVAFGSALTDQAWGARTSSVMQKGTIWLGSLLFVASLATALLQIYKHQNESATLLTKPALPGSEATAPAKAKTLEEQLKETLKAAQTEAPKTEQAKPEAPKTEAPKTEEAQPEAPKTEAPAPAPAQ